MKKLKLDLDDLQVDSFATTPELERNRGTVFGQTDGHYSDCAEWTCIGLTCGPSCGDCNTTYCNDISMFNDCGPATLNQQHSCNGYTECCASTTACGSIDTQDCGACAPDTDFRNSCTDYGCSGCGGVC